jgi:hypothetical protein
MLSTMPNLIVGRRWTDPLGARLLEGLPLEALRELAGGPAAGDSAKGPASPSRLRRALLEQARSDGDLQRRIMRAWRSTHADVAAAAQIVHVAVSDVASQAEALLAHFPAEDVLLELLTDEHDDGWELAREFVDHLAGAGLRQRMAALLEAWSAVAEPPQTPLARVVVFGGHPRDESRFAPLFAGGCFDVRWRTCEKRQGDSSDARLVIDALTYADAAIIVTGMASHNLMELVRRYAKQFALRWTCINKTTDAQLSAALQELFPEGPKDPDHPAADP